MPKDQDNDILEAGHIVDVHFRLALPAAASKAQILDWVMLALGRGSVATSNPLADHDVEALEEAVLYDSRSRIAAGPKA